MILTLPADTERTLAKLVRIAGGNPALVHDAMRRADPECRVPRLERIVDYIVQARGDHTGGA